VKRIFERLLDDHGAEDISYQMVRGYVTVRRRRSSSGRRRMSEPAADGLAAPGLRWVTNTGPLP
jgi:hypothetical protein